MSWPMVSIESVAKVITGKTPPKADSNCFGGNIPFITPSELTDSDYLLKPDTTLTEKGLATTKLIPKNSILVCCIGSLGKMAMADLPVATNQQINSVIFDEDKIYYRFGFYALKLLKNELKNIAPSTTVAIVNKSRFSELKIPRPPLEEQRRIADILDKAADIRQKREQAVKLADDFLRATFLEMFGDPVANPKRWDVASLLEYGSFKNGMNFTKGESGSVLKCLGVGNFKSLATITCMDNIDEIELNTLPSDDYLLKDGDIVFVRSNGNKTLVGRCLTIYPNKEKVTFSGFCIRYRIEKSAITAEYLNFLFRTPSMKQQMLSGGQGANIQNISQGTLSALRIPVPPLEKQQTFSKIVSFHSELMKKINIDIVETNDMFGSISQKYFN
ncbi:restriction endonuclease subunit S [Enterobacter hormaechei]|uniref:restriction endonuclease subunit S n=1 Tax=Enterobacter hormaechei TaxID=158836 RepID=UPI0019317224|nr:restriction endonuclease subunit S [Enterobacter hormaechei]MBL7680102.1 restriction endonuclease subunit S [Enterobacter hormaechei]